MNKKIKFVRFITKNYRDWNCWVDIDSKYIKFMLINNIKMKICLHDNILEKEQYINEFFIKFRGVYDKRFGFEICTNSVQFKIKKLHEYNDITRISLIYDDDEIINYDVVTWEEEKRNICRENIGRRENIYQQSRFDDDNNLILKIDKHKSLEDYIKMYTDFVDDKNDKELKNLPREKLIQMIKELKR